MRTSTNILNFPTKPKLPRVPLLKIGGRSYRLSNIPAPIFEELVGEEGTSRFGFLWLATERYVGMWRVSDGENKLDLKIQDLAPNTFRRLRAQGTLNEVTQAEWDRVASFMERRSTRLLKRLQRDYEEGDPDFAAGKKLAIQFFKNQVVPAFRRTFSQYRKGIVPIWVSFNVDSAFPRDRQAASQIFEHFVKKIFTEDAVENLAREANVPLGMQDAYFIVNEVVHEFAGQILPRV